jgi:molybdopterin synthase catalytic subunit
MRITVVYLGGSRVQAGCERESLELTQGATVARTAALVAARHPRLAPLLAAVRWARNYELAAADETLAEGDELALLPPVAGGAPRAVVTAEPLDADAVIARVAGPDAGAVVVFLGTVRNHSQGKSIVRLEYEAYEPMATRQLERIATEGAPPGARLAIAHRTGTLPPGTTSVVVAAAAPHREEAFAACRAAIERIKTDVPIWKKEVAEGGEAWVGWGGG